MEYLIPILAIVFIGLTLIAAIAGFAVLVGFQVKESPEAELRRKLLAFLDGELDQATDVARVRELTELRTQLAPLVTAREDPLEFSLVEKLLLFAACEGLAALIAATGLKVTLLLEDFYLRSHFAEYYQYPDHSRFQYILLLAIIAAAALVVAMVLGYVATDRRRSGNANNGPSSQLAS